MVETLAFRLWACQDEYEEDNAANEWNKPEERHPPAVVGIMQTANNQRHCGDERSQGPGKQETKRDDRYNVGIVELRQA